MIDLVRIRERKIVQVAIAYTAVAWALLQGLQFLAETYDWPPAVLRALPALLVTGLFIVLTLAWFHGERGQQRVSAAEAMILAAFLVAGLSGAVVLGKTGERNGPPLVMMMDSPAPERVYDEETLRVNGTNADVISDILLDLPIRRQKESIGPGWHRDEEIRQFEPDLILIHFSAFCQKSPCGPDLERMRQFVQYFGDTDTQFLIYSRGRLPWAATCAQERSCERRLRAAVDSLLMRDSAEYRTLRRRVHVFGIQDYGPPRWHEPVVASALKLRVRKLLDLE